MKLRCMELTATGLLLAALPIQSQPAVRGQILDPQGIPLADARVELLPVTRGYEQGLRRLAGRDSEPVTATRTDASGRFHLAAGEPGVFGVRASAPRRMTLLFEPLPLVEETNLPPAVLPEDAGAALVIRDASRRPAAGLWVFAEWEGEAPHLGGWRLAPRIGRTAADGSLRLPRRPDETLRVRTFLGAGLEEVREGLTGGDVLLGATGAAERQLRVVDPRGQPLPGILVRLGEAAWPAGLTGADGRILLRFRGPARARLVSADGRQSVANLAAGSEEEVLVLPDAAVLTGRVSQEEDGRPLAGALIWSRTDPGVFTLVDAAGHYRATALQGGAFQLEAQAPGRLPQRLSGKAPRTGEGRAPSLSLARAGEIVGRVVDAAGAAVPDAWVSAAEAQEGESDRVRHNTVPVGAATGTDGSFRLGRLAPGSLQTIAATKPGFLPAEVELALPAAARPTPVALVLARARPAAGRIVDRDGRPVPGAEVRLSPRSRHETGDARVARRPGTDGPADATSDPRGRFAVAAIPASGFDIEVVRPGYARATVRGFPVPQGAGTVDLGQIVLRPGAAVTGIVVDGRGRPIQGAGIFRVETLRAPEELAAELRAVPPDAGTDAQGRFSLPDQPRGLPVHLLVSAPGFLPQTIRGVRPPTAAPLRVRLDSGIAFAGRVLDPEKKPVAGAGVELRWRAAAPGHPELVIGPPVSRTATTGSDGRFELAGFPGGGRGKLAVVATGFVAVENIEVALPQPPGAEETVLLARGSTLEGQVTTTAGEPVPGVRVTAGSAACLSDAEGFFHSDGVPPGPLAVEASHPHYPRYRKKVDIQEGLNRLEIVFKAGEVVRGRVVDSAGRPVGGATASLEAEPRSAGRSYRARTDPEGAFVLQPVAAGRYRLRASARGYLEARQPDLVTVAQEAVDGLEIVLEPGGSIAGHIVGLDRDELARVAVRAEHESGESAMAEVDAAGRYALPALRPGGWLVQATVLDGQRQARARAFLAPAEEKTLDLRFGGRLTLSGRVFYRDEALPDAGVSIRGQRLAVERSTITDHEGAFRFEDLDPDTYELGLNQASELVVHNETVDLTADRDLVIRLERQIVAGRVIEATGDKPVGDAIVSLRHLPDGSGPEFVIADASDTNGAFRLERVPPGRYQMRAVQESYSPFEQLIDVPRGSDLADLELPLTPAPGVQLILRRAAGGAPRTVYLRLLSPSGAAVLAESRPVGAGGKVRLSTVPAGSWMLLAASPDGALTSTPLAVPGEPVSLVLPDAARLSVRVPALATSDLLGSVALVSADGRVFQTLGPGGELQQSWPLVAGRATVDGLPAGSWVVSAMAPDGQRWSLPMTSDGRTEAQVSLDGASR